MKVIINGKMTPDAERVFKVGRNICFFYHSELGTMETYICPIGSQLTCGDFLDTTITLYNAEPIMEQINNYLAKFIRLNAINRLIGEFIMTTQMDEARKVLLKNGYSIIKEGYENATATQMAGMKERLQNYIDTGSEFKIKSKSNKLGLIVYIIKDENNGWLILYNANTCRIIAQADNIDSMIKKIYDIQAHLEQYQKEESFLLDHRH